MDGDMETGTITITDGTTHTMAAAGTGDIIPHISAGIRPYR